MKRRSAFKTAADLWEQLPPELKTALIYGGKKLCDKILEKLKNGEIKLPSFISGKAALTKNKSHLAAKKDPIIILPEFPDDRDPWWRVLKIKPYATEYEIHTAYEKLLEKSHPKKTGMVSARVLKERARKAVRLQQAYEDALESLKRRE